MRSNSTAPTALGSGPRPQDAGEVEETGVPRVCTPKAPFDAVLQAFGGT